MRLSTKNWDKGGEAGNATTLPCQHAQPLFATCTNALSTATSTTVATPRYTALIVELAPVAIPTMDFHGCMRESWFRRTGSSQENVESRILSLVTGTCEESATILGGARHPTPPANCARPIANQRSTDIAFAYASREPSPPMMTRIRRPDHRASETKRTSQLAGHAGQRAPRSRAGIGRASLDKRAG